MLGVPRSVAGTVSEQLLVHCLTFNLAFEAPRKLPATLLKTETPCSLLAVATQENGDVSFWDALLCKELSNRRYRRLASTQLMSMHLALFIKNDRHAQVQSVEHSSVATGIGNLLGNKGAVGICVEFVSGLRLLFVGAHFAAHSGRVERRKENYDRIEHRLRHDLLGARRSKFRLRSRDNRIHDVAALERLGLLRDPDVHGTIWMGDLNYRVDGNRDCIDQALVSGLVEVLHSNDELSRERRQGRVFHGFHEAPIHFQPTYKFDKGTQNYDTSAKMRIPAWPDRILWRSDAAQMTCLSYTSIREITISDHKPVQALFRIHLKPLPNRRRV